MDTAIFIITAIFDAAVIAGESIRVNVFGGKKKGEDTERESLEARVQRAQEADEKHQAELHERVNAASDVQTAAVEKKEQTFLKSFKTLGNGFRSMFNTEKTPTRNELTRNEVKTRNRR